MDSNSDTKMKVNMGQLQKDVEYIREMVEHIEKELEDRYVTKEKFAPIQNIVYGMVGAILLAFLYALINSHVI